MARSSSRRTVDQIGFLHRLVLARLSPRDRERSPIRLELATVLPTVIRGGAFSRVSFGRIPLNSGAMTSCLRLQYPVPANSNTISFRMHAKGKRRFGVNCEVVNRSEKFG